MASRSCSCGEACVSLVREGCQTSDWSPAIPIHLYEFLDECKPHGLARASLPLAQAVLPRRICRRVGSAVPRGALVLGSRPRLGRGAESAGRSPCAKRLALAADRESLNRERLTGAAAKFRCSGPQFSRALPAAWVYRWKWSLRAGSAMAAIRSGPGAGGVGAGLRWGQLGCR